MAAIDPFYPILAHPFWFRSHQIFDNPCSQECAEHFGKCSVNELKELKEGRSRESIAALFVSHQPQPVAHFFHGIRLSPCRWIGLHRKRIQEIVFGDLNNAVTTAPEEIFQERLLEEELSLQLSLLHDEMPPAYLFTTNMPAPFEETDDGNQQGMHQGDTLAAQVKEAEQNHVLEELVEDGALDSLAICALIGMLMLAPQLFLQ